MRVALVGGAGFIGHHLALKLSGHVFIADSLCWNNLVQNVSRPDAMGDVHRSFLLERFALLQKAGVEMSSVDARDYATLRRALEGFGPTHIVHMAAISSAVQARLDPGLCFDLQLVTLRNTLEIARDLKARVLFMSSSTVYGDFEGDEVTEDTRPRPKGIYANAKYMGERLCRTYSEQYGLDTVIVRPSALYGERCVSGRVSQKFIENALAGKPLLLEGGGSGMLDFTYIEDLVDGLARALKAPGRTNTFNLTYGRARSIADLAAIVKDIVPEAVIEERPRDDSKPVRGTLSTVRAKEVLGFEPRWPLETGYRRYCEWYVDAVRASGGGPHLLGRGADANQAVQA